MDGNSTGQASFTLTLSPDISGFDELPWNLPLSRWNECCTLLEELPRGISRHTVLFINHNSQLFALKEMPARSAAKEYELLRQLEVLRLPVVNPVGYALTHTPTGSASVLITRYLDRSLPFRSLFMRTGLERYRDHLLDAMAGLLVQLHLTGAYWGDCSLSNTLFRRDAGALQAYLVDAETVEIHPEPLAPALRIHDLDIMEVNVDGDLADLRAIHLTPPELAGLDAAAYLRFRYQKLWEEITREMIIPPDETFRIHERIRALNQLGFSVGEVELKEGENGGHLRLKVVVTDRNFHRDQLHGLTGLLAEEHQAQEIMNEIQELKARLSHDQNRSTPLSVAAHHWLEYVYMPVVEQLLPLEEMLHLTRPELYCQLLEHKWFLSERARQDVGHQYAAQDFLEKFSSS